MPGVQGAVRVEHAGHVRGQAAVDTVGARDAGLVHLLGEPDGSIKNFVINKELALKLLPGGKQQLVGQADSAYPRPY